MKNKQVLCVAYGADDNYAKFLGISMTSLFQTNEVFDKIDVFVMDCEISDLNKEKLISIAEEYNRSIYFIDMKKHISELDLKMGVRKISIASYARLFLSSVIPEEYGRVLYLDCDTIIMDELTNLWNTDLDGFMIAGVQDTVDKYFLSKIGLTQDDFYVNSGIMLINLSVWRSGKLKQSFIDFIKKYNGNVPHHDQGTINAVCNKSKRILSPRYNVTSNIYSFSAKTIKRIYYMNSYYHQVELNEAKKRPVIIHFTTGLVGRPWEENCSHPRKDEYIRIAANSPWKDSLLQPDSRKVAVKVFHFFYKYTPHIITETAYRLGNWIMHLRK